MTNKLLISIICFFLLLIVYKINEPFYSNVYDLKSLYLSTVGKDGKRGPLGVPGNLIGDLSGSDEYCKKDHTHSVYSVTEHKHLDDDIRSNIVTNNELLKEYYVKGKIMDGIKNEILTQRGRLTNAVNPENCIQLNKKRLKDLPTSSTYPICNSDPSITNNICASTENLFDNNNNRDIITTCKNYCEEKNKPNFLISVSNPEYDYLNKYETSASNSNSDANYLDIYNECICFDTNLSSDEVSDDNELFTISGSIELNDDDNLIC